MATTFTGLTAFVNEQANRTDFWLEALFGNDVMPFIDATGMVIRDMKEDTRKLPLLTQTVTIDDGAVCTTDFDRGNDATITQSTVTAQKGIIADSMCPHGEAWETYFTALGMPAGQHYKSLGIWQPYLIAEIQRQVAKRLAINFWQGNQSGDGWTFNGWMDQLLAANVGTYNSSSNVTGAILGSGTPTAGGANGTDAEGVYNILQTGIEAIMNTQQIAGSDLAAALMAGDMVVIMNPLNREFLRQNYLKLHGLAMPEIAVGLSGLQNNTFGAFNFPGYNLPVITQAWIPQSTIIFTRRRNMGIAFDLQGDTNKLVMGMDQYEEFMWWKYRFKVGVFWRALNGSNMKYWGPTT